MQTRSGWELRCLDDGKSKPFESKPELPHAETHFTFSDSCLPPSRPHRSTVTRSLMPEVILALTAASSFRRH